MKKPINLYTQGHVSFIRCTVTYWLQRKKLHNRAFYFCRVYLDSPLAIKDSVLYSLLEPYLYGETPEVNLLYKRTYIFKRI